MKRRLKEAFSERFDNANVGNHSFNVQFSINRKRGYDWLTAGERGWLVRWADVRGGGRGTGLGTSAWEAKNARKRKEKVVFPKTVTLNIFNDAQKCQLHST